MAAKLTIMTHKIEVKLHLVAESFTTLFAVLAPGGQSGNFWIHPRIVNVEVKLDPFLTSAPDGGEGSTSGERTYKIHWVRRLGGSRKRSGRGCEEKKKSLPLPTIEVRPCNL
jgi:hypothetical protein